MRSVACVLYSVLQVQTAHVQRKVSANSHQEGPQKCAGYLKSQNRRVKTKDPCSHFHSRIDKTDRQTDRPRRGTRTSATSTSTAASLLLLSRPFTMYLSAAGVNASASAMRNGTISRANVRKPAVKPNSCSMRWPARVTRSVGSFREFNRPARQYSSVGRKSTAVADDSNSEWWRGYNTRELDHCFAICPPLLGTHRSSQSEKHCAEEGNSDSQAQQRQRLTGGKQTGRIGPYAGAARPKPRIGTPHRTHQHIRMTLLSCPLPETCFYTSQSTGSPVARCVQTSGTTHTGDIGAQYDIAYSS